MNRVSSLTALVLDHRPQYLSSSPRSLLTLSVGRASLLQYIDAQITHSLGAHSLTVVPSFDIESAYCAEARRILPRVAVQSADDARDLLSDLEPSDWVLIVDPAFCTAEGLDLDRLGAETRDARAATHLIALATGSGLTGERIQVDGRSRIRRIQRWYSGITDLRASGVVASILPVSSLRTLDETPHLTPTELRQQLTKCGIPIRDITSPGTALDLFEPAQMLQFNGRFLQCDAPHPNSGALRLSGAGDVWQERGVSVDASARLYGPIILREGCRIDADAVVVGPVVVGRNAHIGSNAIVANAILDDATIVPADSTVCDQIACGAWGGSLATPDSGAAEESAERPTPMQQPGARLSSGPSGLNLQFAIKRALDIVLAFIGLVLLSPLMLLTAVLIKLTSRGPVLFGHIREGRSGREFRCLKFRTMEAGAHEKQRELYRQSNVDGPQFKLAHDPRVTWLGSWLRSTNVDELPQLINVVLGHMSLIGPRPSPFRENQICIPWRKARLSVRPGITGLWQVCRHERATGDFHQWIHYDMLYVRRWTLRLDMGILIATVATFGGWLSVPVNWLIPRAQSGGSSSDPLFAFDLANRREWFDLCLPAGNVKSGKYSSPKSSHAGKNGHGNVAAPDASALYNKIDVEVGLL